ncbi:MAG: sigma-54 dependent transcriptional regulator [Proteobacteria bacterium]|nr:sigma-54 dependent transcriptional regulator [Pseudomonadota bacterium]MBU1738539.1 sigma-54 dependent transcriptional regulator [Pseudomonadota bacterium]
MHNQGNGFPATPVLLVDDEESWLNSFSLVLRSAGITNILTCNDGRRVLGILAGQPVSTVVLDLTMPEISGEELLPLIAEQHPAVPIIIVTGLDLLETAVNCIKLGAYDFFTKMTEEDRLVGGVKRAIDLGRLRHEHASLKQRFLNDTLDHPEAFASIITHNKGMRAVFQYIETVAATNEPVLITGETGVGKELVAKAIHELSGRKGKFVPINIASLDETMLADTLFGHCKGAFTGADQARPGLIEQAGGGTLFLDEIGDLPTSSQIKLLRLLQEREYHPLGSDLPKRTDCRMIFATLRSLDEIHHDQTFRRDLLFRLQTHHVHVPPLRERLDDLPILLDHFLAEAAESLNRPQPNIPRELPLLLSTYDFPGNIRELRSMVVDSASRHPGGTMSMDNFKNYIRQRTGSFSEEFAPESLGSTPFSPLKTLPTLKEASELLVREALIRTGGNQRLAAEMLGITRQALNWRLKQEQRPDQK